jgi:hypothetical protein
VNNDQGKGDVMKTGFVQKISRNTLMAFWTLVLVAITFGRGTLRVGQHSGKYGNYQ